MPLLQRWHSILREGLPEAVWSEVCVLQPIYIWQGAAGECWAVRKEIRSLKIVLKRVSAYRLLYFHLVIMKNKCNFVVCFLIFKTWYCWVGRKPINHCLLIYCFCMVSGIYFLFMIYLPWMRKQVLLAYYWVCATVISKNSGGNRK
jgi:hypothetical protein